MSDIDPAAVMTSHAKHDPRGGCLRGAAILLPVTERCEPYRLAEALAATVDELTDTQDQLAQAEQMLTAEHAAHERVNAAIRHLGNIAQTERQLAAEQAKAARVEAERDEAWNEGCAAEAAEWRSETKTWGPVAEIAAQRIKNHEKWGELSIENRPPNYRGWLPTLGEEYGEVCRALTIEQGDPGRLRSELIDVAAVALMWLDSIDRAALADQPEVQP